MATAMTASEQTDALEVHPVFIDEGVCEAYAAGIFNHHWNVVGAVAMGASPATIVRQLQVTNRFGVSITESVRVRFRARGALTLDLNPGGQGTEVSGADTNNFVADTNATGRFDLRIQAAAAVTNIEILATGESRAARPLAVPQHANQLLCTAT